MTLSFEDLKQKISKAMRESYVLGKEFWIIETFLDFIIVEDYSSDKIYKIGYSVDESGDVSITAAPIEMKKVYIEINQSQIMAGKSSDYPAWGAVDKSKLPKGAFLIVGDPKKKSTWRFPYKYLRDGKLVIHPGGVLAAWQYRRYIKDTTKLARLRSLYEKYWGKKTKKK